MDWMAILIATAVVGGIGVIIGLLLGVAGEKLKVETDPRIDQVRACLPGNNCGGCGYPGCDGLAAAIVAGEAKPNACPVGGAAVGNAVSQVLGVEVEDTKRRVAFVKCSGTCDHTEHQYHYFGIHSCLDAFSVPGRGDKSCQFGCIGYGSCVDACAFDAIHVIDGVAQVNRENCVACGKCVATCPNHLIELVPYEAPVIVRCSSQWQGKAVREVCQTGCIGCGICQKLCPQGAITLTNHVAHVDYAKCIGCGICVSKCPQKVILQIRKPKDGRAGDTGIETMGTSSTDET